MTAPLVSMLGGLLASLEGRVADSGWPAPEAAYAAHVFASLPGAATETSNRLAGELTAAAVADVDEARWREAPVLAAAGYLLADAASSGLTERWVAGVERLAERDPFPPDRASFFYRPVELLGLARGAAAAGAPAATFRGWLTGVARDGERRVPDDVWHRGLAAAAADVLGAPWSLSLAASEVAAAAVEEIALLVWLATAYAAAGERLLGSDERLQATELERTLLERAVFEPVDAADAARAAVTAAALRHAVEATLESAHGARWQLDRSERDATDVIVNLCRRFPRYVLQLATRHDSRAALQIADEYDLQDNLHALLRLHFDDVREEVWTPNYGGIHTRMDFLLKREKTVVETKRPARDSTSARSARS